MYLLILLEYFPLNSGSLSPLEELRQPDGRL